MSRSPAIAEDRAGRVVLAATLIAGTALRLWLAWTEHGIHWPDEIYPVNSPVLAGGDR